ncbi:hypothetical protein [Niveibacterium terrae]|uniref:hypothetical protein n=1 Tax=Niveibacterium terrae TaxID=3373598 RepID=UPI003A92C643
MTVNPLGGAVARCTAFAHRLVPGPGVRFWGAVIFKLAALPLLMMLCVWLDTLALAGAVRLIPSDYHGRSFLFFGSLLAQGFLPACVVASVLCYPLALLYRRFALAAALMCCLPFIAIWVLLNPYRSVSLIGGVLHAYEQISLLVLLIVGTWLARASLLRRLHTEFPARRSKS